MNKSYPENDRTLKIRSVPGKYAVARMTADADVPNWLNGPGFQAIIRSDDELSLVCLEDRVPSGIEVERGWICLRTIGPFPFDATGVVQSLITPLSENGIGIFVICTFDGEHVLIPASDARKAILYLKRAGHILDGNTSKVGDSDHC